MMGNRGGRIHTGQRELSRRRYASRRWICCACDFRGRQRKVWGDSYTEMFSLDEATALAAGHRPCFECRSGDARQFAALFPDAPGGGMKADAMDVILHRQRIAIWNGQRQQARPGDLPDGAMVAEGKNAFAIRSGVPLRWHFDGYRRDMSAATGIFDVLTPAAIIHVLQAGYQPQWHGSAK